ncbi:DUF4349 domain-containing protein [Alteribacillus iranensis]|uniref:DUF4349 domain-containing protein n=1 Tax=Alteribacillus iranensis TaxID=930128 RepID=A0A1I2BDF4_9BACI|nr:DUF4349 domain-containing protein [Alteribacillus iranensis]SFE53180.1 protein of unknown function [Alteribacillus iranensis]
MTGIILLFLLMVTAGCSNNDSGNEAAVDGPSSSVGESDQPTVEQRDDAGSVEEASDSREAENNAEVIDNANQSERKVIFHGDMTIEVSALEEVQSHIQQRVEEVDGYIVESSVNESENDRRRGTLVARVPQEHFSSFLDEVESASQRVVRRSTRGNDVTEEYVDLESRLRSKETVEQRLTTFMEEAENTEDLLNISNELSAVQEEIERLEGRIQYLDNRVDYATATIQMEEHAASSLQDSDSLETWSKAKNLFMSSINGIVSFFSTLIVFVVGLSPILVPLLAITALLLFIRKRKAGKEKGE